MSILTRDAPPPQANFPSTPDLHQRLREAIEQGLQRPVWHTGGIRPLSLMRQQHPTCTSYGDALGAMSPPSWWRARS